MTGDEPRRETRIPAHIAEKVAGQAVRDFVFEEVGSLRRKLDAIAGYMRKQESTHNTNHKLAEEELQGHFDTIVKMFDDQTQKNDMQDLSAIGQIEQVAKLFEVVESDYNTLKSSVNAKFGKNDDQVGDIQDDIITLGRDIGSVKSQLPKMEKKIHKAIDTKFNSLEKTQTKAAKDAENKHVALARQNDTKFEQLDKRIQTYQHDTTRSIGAKFDRSDAKFETHHTKIIEVENLANAKADDSHNHDMSEVEGQIKALNAIEPFFEIDDKDHNVMNALHHIDMKDNEIFMELEVGTAGRHGVRIPEKRVSIKEYVQTLAKRGMAGGGGGGGGSVLSAGEFVMNDTDFDTTSMPNAVYLGETDIMTVLNEPTGFPNRTDSTLSWTVGTRTLTITPSNGSFDFWEAATKYTKTAAESIIVADTNGVHFIYYDAGVLSQVANPSHATLDPIITSNALVGIMYWNTNTNEAPIVADERHGTHMSSKTHEFLHDSVGATYHTGLALSDYIEDTESDAALTFKISDGGFFDEDIEHAIADGTATNQYEQQLSGADAEIPILYRDDVDSSWKEDAATTLPYKSLGAGRLAYNKDDGDGTFSQVEVTDNKWVSMTLIATNDWQYPIKAIQGQNLYTTKASAVEEASAEILAFGTFPTAETLVLYRLVLNTKDTYAGTKKAKIEVDGVTDFRAARLSGASAVANDHGGLSGLDDDDHAQYVLADGTRPDTNFTTHLADTTDPHGSTMDVSVKITTPILSDTGVLKIQDLGAGNVSLFEDQATATQRYLEVHAPNSASMVRLHHTGVHGKVTSTVGTIVIQSNTYVQLQSSPGQPQYYDAGALFYWRDRDDSDANRMTLNSETGALTLVGTEGDNTSINTFSTDDTLAGDSDDAVPTEQAVKAYVDASAGADANAIHVNAGSEISGIAEKGAPVGGDMIVIEDSESANAKKMVQITNLPGGADADAFHDNVASEIIGVVANKATLADADEFLIEDSEAANVKKAILWSVLEGEISHANIADVGIDTHATIDTFIDNYVAGGDGTDTTAIHDDTAGEITAIGAKGTVVGSDVFVIEDYEDSEAKKSMLFSVLEAGISHTNIADVGTDSHATIDTFIDNYVAGGAGTDTTAIHDNVAGEIVGQIGNKGSIVAADEFLIEDTEDSNNKKALLFSVLEGAIDHESLTNGHVHTATANLHYPVGMGVPFMDGGANDVDMEWNWDNTNLHASVLVTVNDTDQDGDWLFEIYLPDDFASFASDAMKYWYNSSDDTNAGVTMSVTDGTDTFTDARQQATSWTQVTVTAAELTTASVASSAGSKLIIRVKADGDGSDIVYIGGFDIFYNKA